MGYKNNDSCLAKVADDEPIFVLRAQDNLMPVVLATWIGLARWAGVPAAKIQEAENLLNAAYEWQKNHPHKIPD